MSEQLQCPKCNNIGVYTSETLPSGTIRYQCTSCKKKFTLTQKKAGRSTIGDKPMSGCERVRQHRKKKKYQSL